MEGWGFLSLSGEVSREVDVAASFDYCSSSPTEGWDTVDSFQSNSSNNNHNNNTSTKKQDNETTTMVWGGRSVFITAGEEELSSITNSSRGTPPKGTSLHDYERITRLGRGGFGSVYKAKNKITGEVVAIKISQYAFPSIKEMEFLQMCNCPQIIRYYSAFKNSDSGSSPTMWMVIEYCGGGSVEDLIQTEDLDMYQIATIMSGLLKAVVYLHDHDILHRDIKPGNILLTSDGETKLADLGCSRELRPGEMAHTLMGTQAFMAPEFFVGGIGYTQKADIWAIGVTALDIAIKISCLESPLFYLQLSKADSFESYLRSKLSFFPPSFQDFVCACLNRKPTRRPTSRELLEHPFLKEFARDSRCLQQLSKSQEERLNKDKEIIEPLVRLGNASSKGNTLLKEDLLSACVDVVERISSVADALLRRSSSVHDPQRVSLFEDLKRIVDTKSPRILLVGRTGSGKSALLNALAGEYIASIGSLGPETRKPTWYKLAHVTGQFYVMDSPGRQEVQHANIMEQSFVLVEENSLLSLSDCLLEEEVPDLILFLCKADDILHGGDREDIHFLRDVLDETKRRSGSYPLVMGIVTHVDALDPTNQLLPGEYGAQKKSNIEIARRKLHARLVDAFASGNTNGGGKKQEDAGLMPSLLETYPLSSIMAWDLSKKHFTDYRYNVDNLLSYLSSDKLLARLSKSEEKRKANVNDLFGRRWLKYLQGVLEELKAAGCSQGQYSLLADTVLQMLVRLIGAIYHVPTKDIDFFWQKFVEESNLVWDKGEVGKIIAHQWGILSWTSKPTDCDLLMAWLYTAAHHFFSRVASASDVQSLAKASFADLHKKIWKNCTGSIL